MYKRGDVAYIILGFLAVAGVIAILPLAPGLGMILKLIDPNPRKAAAKMDRALQALTKGGKVARTKEGYRLQDSVFVTPQPCGEILKLIQQGFFLQKHVRGMVVTQIDDEEAVLRYFKLER